MSRRLAKFSFELPILKGTKCRDSLKQLRPIWVKIALEGDLNMLEIPAIRSLDNGSTQQLQYNVEFRHWKSESVFEEF